MDDEWDRVSPPCGRLHHTLLLPVPRYAVHVRNQHILFKPTSKPT